MATEIIQEPDGSLSLKSDLTDVKHLRVGGPPTSSLSAATTGGNNYRAPKWIHGLMAVSNATAATINVQNPEGTDVMITRFAIMATAVSTTTTTIDAGISASASGTSDSLLDGVTIGATAFTTEAFDNISVPGTNGKATRFWPSGNFIVAKASATATGFAGHWFVEYIIP